jgi:multicomponent Na+:H+ antiporter subunit D
MTWLLSLPIIIPFATAVAAFTVKDRPSGAWVSILGSLLSLLVAGALMVAVLRDGVIAAQMGQWPRLSGSRWSRTS